MRCLKVSLKISLCVVLSMLPVHLQASDDFWYPSDQDLPVCGHFYSQTDNVFLVGSAVFAGDLYDVLYHNGYLCIADGKQYYSGNLKIFDVSDPENPSTGQVCPPVYTSTASPLLGRGLGRPRLR